MANITGTTTCQAVPSTVVVFRIEASWAKHANVLFFDLHSVHTQGFEYWAVVQRKQNGVILSGTVFVFVVIPRRHHEAVSLLPLQGLRSDCCCAAAAKYVVRGTARVAVRFGLLTGP